MIYWKGQLIYFLVFKVFKTLIFEELSSIFKCSFLTFMIVLYHLSVIFLQMCILLSRDNPIIWTIWTFILPSSTFIVAVSLSFVTAPLTATWECFSAWNHLQCIKVNFFLYRPIHILSWIVSTIQWPLML